MYKNLCPLVALTQAENEESKEESGDLEGQGIKIMKRSNINDVYTRLEILLGLNLSGHTDTLTEAANLIGEVCKSGEKQIKQQYRNALDKFYTK